jgi:hypothetical protein
MPLSGECRIGIDDVSIGRLPQAVIFADNSL